MSSSSTIESLSISRDPRRILQVRQSNNRESGIPEPPPAVNDRTTTIPAAAESSSNRSVEEIRSGLQAFHKKRRIERTVLSGDNTSSSLSPSSSSRATTKSSPEGDIRLPSLKQWKPYNGNMNKLSEHSGKERPKPKKAIFTGGDATSKGFITQPRYGRKLINMLLEDNGITELLIKGGLQQDGRK